MNTSEAPPLKAEKFYWAVVMGNGRLLEWTIATHATTARGKVVQRRAPWPSTWYECRKRCWRVVKVKISGFQT